MKVIIITFSVWMLLPNIGLIHAANNHNVLVLHSYHKGYAWTDDIMEGMESVFQKTDIDLNVHIEYMDTKRHLPTESFPLLKALYKYRYQDIHFDVILVSDNNALNFLLSYRDELFPEVPVVFCGINNFSDSMLKGHRAITGIAEDIDIKETIELALLIHPETDTVAIVNDNTPTGINNQERLMLETAALREKITFLNFADTTFEELQKELSNLPANAIVLMFTFHIDRTGRHITLEEYVPLLSVNVPTYSMWRQYLGQGIVGGKLLDGAIHGRHAANMAISIIQGASADSLLIRKSPNFAMFDYSALQRFGIDRSLLPQDALIVNKPSSMYDIYKIYIWAFGTGIVSLFILFIFLLQHRARRTITNINVQLTEEIEERKHAEKLLQTSEEKFSKAFHVSPDSISLSLLEDGRITEVNEGFVKLTGYPRDEAIGKTSNELNLWVDPDDRVKIAGIMKDIGVIRDLEVDIRSKSGEIRSCIISFELIIIDGKQHMLSVGRDISIRKRADEQLFESHKRLLMVLDGIDALIYVADMDTYEILFMNKFGRDIWGDIQGKICWQELQSGQKGPCEFCTNKYLLDSEGHPAETYTWEFQNTVNNHWYYIQDRAIRWVDRPVVRMEIATDITYRKKADELLRESEERFMGAFNYASIGIGLVSPEGRWLKVNPALCNIVGYSEDELLSLTFQDITYAEDLETDLKYVHQMLAGEIQNYHMEKRYIHKKGHIVWILLSVSLVKDINGNPLYFVSQIQDISRRKSAIEALKASEQRFRGLVETSSDLIWEVDENACYNFVSSNVIDILGYEPQEILGKTPFDLMPQDEAKRVADIFAPFAASQKHISRLENVNLHKNGHEVVLETSGVPFFDSNGEFSGYRGIDRDISDRKKTEIALEESEKKYRRFFTTVPNAWAYHKIILDKNNKSVDYLFLEVNEAFEKQTGLKRDEIIGRRVTEVLPGIEKDPADWIGKYGQVALTGKEIRFENYSKNINKWFAITASSPEKGYFIIVSDDITERKEVEQKITNQKDFLNSIFESLTHPLYVINVDNYEVTHMNSAARPDKDSDGITCYKLSHGFDSPCDTDEHPCVVELVKDKKVPVSVEHTHFDKHGAPMIVEVHGYPIFDKEGKVKQVIEYTLDISDRKKAEEERERLNKELEQIIHATSHDLRSPLVNISGYSKELKYSLDDIDAVLKELNIPADKMEKIKSITEEDIAESMKYITSSINKMDSLLSSLLKLSKSGSVEMIITDCNMNSIVSDVLDAMEYQLVTAGAKCEVSELPLCRGDERQVNQLFSNLIGNAIKYLDPERDGIIKVTGYKKKYLSVYCVEDNGIGIEHEDLIRIFDVFHQISPDSEGEGIGLSIVKKIIDRLGGDIWIESEPAMGSKFYVSLPN